MAKLSRNRDAVVTVEIDVRLKKLCGIAFNGDWLSLRIGVAGGVVQMGQAVAEGSEGPASEYEAVQ